MSSRTNSSVLQVGKGERHVLVVITGGTICMQNSPDGLVPTKDFVCNCLTPGSDFNDGSILEGTSVVDEYDQIAVAPTLRPPRRSANMPKYLYSVLEFSELIDSSSTDGSHWNRILKCLLLNWTSFEAFVVLHGTDTLAYTASALSFMLGSSSRTVIVTGSQLSMYAPHNDAHDNLLDSLTAAAIYNLPEVSVVFHHHLYRATRVTKVSAFSMAAFVTPNAKPLASFPVAANRSWTAHIHSDSIKLASGAPQERSYDANIIPAPVTVTNTLDTSRVVVLKVYPGISSHIVSSIVQIPNLGGLVLETFGAGNIPMATGSKGLIEILSSAVKRGIVVVSVTQCTSSTRLKYYFQTLTCVSGLTGSVTSAYESARNMERNGIVTGLDMTTEAAYTKLAYLLSLPNMAYEQIVKKMRQDLCGELTADSREEQPRRDSVGSELR